MSNLQQDQEADKSIGDDNTFSQALPMAEGEQQPTSLIEEEPANVYQDKEESSPAQQADNGGDSPGFVDDLKMNQTAAEKTDGDEIDGYATDINMKATNGFDAAQVDDSAKKKPAQTDEEKLKALTARSKLMMLKPFKRDRSIKPIFDKKKIVKQIQKEQMEKYRQKLDLQDADYDYSMDYDDIDYDDEEAEIDEEKGDDLRKALEEFTNMSCHKKVYTSCKNFFSFKLGIMFFSYDNANMSSQESEIGKLPLRSSFFDKAKIALTVVVAISLFFGIIIEYFTKLGTEKSQSVQYQFLSNMTYDLDRIPVLLPFHQYSFFDKSDIEDQIACKVMNKNKECREIEEKRCLSKPKSSQAYEDCRINIMDKMKLNATNLCINLYNDMDVWKDDISPSFAEYYQRKYACLEKTGVPKGQDYCKDIQEVTEGGDTDSLFTCYRRNGVAFGKEFCEYKFNKTANPDIQNSQILDCYAFNNVPKGKEYCDLTFEGDDGVTMQSRAECYDSLFIKDKDYCDIKQVIGLQTDQKLQECYKEAGYTLDKHFCQEAFPLAEQSSLEDQLDSIYACYESIDLTYPQSDTVITGGLKVFKDREYCEILHLSDSVKKYECVQTIAIPNSLAALTAFCEVDNPANVPGCITLKQDGLHAINQHQRLGGDYCYITYFWQDQYELLYDCLEEHSLPKDTSYCQAKFEYDVYKNDMNSFAFPRCETAADSDVDCSQFAVKTEAELYQSLYDCQSGYTSMRGEPFPSADLQCYSLEEDFVHLETITKSKDITLPNVDYGGHNCMHATSLEEDMNPWIEAFFEAEILVNSVEFHVINFEDDNGTPSSLLEGASVYIGDTLCGYLSDVLIADVDQNIVCKDHTGEQSGAYDGAIGKSVKIVANKPGTLTICDLQVYQAEHDHDMESELEHECEEMQAKCTEVFSAKQDGENKYNCLKRYAYPHQKLAAKCLEQHRSHDDFFYYPLMFKYQCLQDPNLPTQLDDEAASCLNNFDSYTIEHCLQDYESKYETIGFYGKNKNDDISLQDDSIEFYFNYGNLTKSFQERRLEKFNQIQAERDELTTQVSISPPAPDAEIGTFICQNSKMRFVSNPFNFGSTQEEREASQIEVDLDCEAFDFTDEEDENSKPQIAVHYYMNVKPEFKGLEKITDEDLQDKLFIDRNTFNEQYFELTFDENFEFLKAKRHIMYQREIGVQDSLEEDQVNSTQEGYIELINNPGTIKMMHSHEHTISLNKVPYSLLETTPQLATYNDMPNEKVTNELEQFLGIPIFFKDYEQDILLFDPVLDMLEIEEGDDDNMEEKMRVKIGFAYIFEKRNFIYNYYTLFDLFNALTGLGNALATFVAQFYVALVILFAIQMNFLARQKNKQDLRRFKYEALLRKIPNFQVVIEKLLRNNYMSKDMKAKVKQQIKDQKLESIKIKKNASIKKSLKKQTTIGQIQQEAMGEENPITPPNGSNPVSPPNELENQGKEKHEHDDKNDEINNQVIFEEQDNFLSDETIRNRKPEEVKLDEIYCGEKGIKEKEDLLLNLENCKELEVSLKERLEEEQNEFLGKVKAADADENYSLKKKQLDFWDLFDDNLEKLENLDMKYGGLIHEKNVDFFNNDKQITRLLKVRVSSNFLERALTLKKRISFFGIFVVDEKIELLNAQYDHMKSQFDNVLNKLVKYENKLVDLSNEDRAKGADLHPQFYLAKNANKVQQGLMMNLKTAFMQSKNTIIFKEEAKAVEEGEKQAKKDRQERNRSKKKNQ